jgi:hypothetical protein
MVILSARAREEARTRDRARIRANTFFIIVLSFIIYNRFTVISFGIREKSCCCHIRRLSRLQSAAQILIIASPFFRYKNKEVPDGTPLCFPYPVQEGRSYAAGVSTESHTENMHMRRMHIMDICMKR